MNINVTRMAADVLRAIAEVGQTVRLRRYAGGVYDPSVTYQSPKAVPVLEVDLDITVAWNLASAKHLVEYFGRLEPDSTTIHTTVLVKAGDLIIKNFGLSTAKSYHIQEARELLVKGTAIGYIAILQEIPGRQGG